MATIRICDVCRDEAGPRLWRLRVAGPVYPHKGEVIVESEGVDVCDGCLRRVPDLSSRLTLDELVRIPRECTESTEGSGN